MSTATITIAASGVDCMIDEGNPNTNFQADTSMLIGNQFVVSDVRRRGLFRFDLSAYNGAIISAATMTLKFLAGGVMPASRTFHAYRLTRADWTEAGATWNKYDGTTAWTGAGAEGDYTTTDGDSVVVPNASTDLVFTNMDELANDALDLRDGMLQLLVRVEGSAGLDRYVSVATGEHGTAANHPKIDITYSYSVHYQCALAAQTVIQNLGLHTLPDAAVLVRKLPWRREGDPLPCAIVGHWQAPAMAPATNLRDDVSYPVQVVLYGAGNQHLTTNQARMSMWRQRIAKAFRSQRLSGVDGIYDCRVDSGSAFDAGQFASANNDASYLKLNFISREFRGTAV